MQRAKQIIIKKGGENILKTRRQWPDFLPYTAVVTERPVAT